jgi:hypothetical protein
VKVLGTQTVERLRGAFTELLGIVDEQRRDERFTLLEREVQRIRVRVERDLILLEAAVRSGQPVVETRVIRRVDRRDFGREHLGTGFDDRLAVAGFDRLFGRSCAIAETAAKALAEFALQITRLFDHLADRYRKSVDSHIGSSWKCSERKPEESRATNRCTPSGSGCGTNEKDRHPHGPSNNEVSWLRFE